MASDTLQTEEGIRLDGRTIAVTGAGSGIGEATTAKLVARGASVWALDRDADGLGRVADLPGVGALTADVSDEASLAAAVERIEAEGALHGVVACAGLGHRAPLEQTTLEDWDRIVGVNLRGMFLTAKLTAPLLERSAPASFVAIASELGTVGDAGHSAYGTSKAGVIQLMRVLALEFATRGVRFNSVAPGGTVTPMLVGELEQQGLPVLEAVPAIPMGRRARPHEIANVVAFLVSSESSFVTGATYLADGGYTAR